MLYHAKKMCVNSPFVFTSAVLQEGMGVKVLPSGLLFVEVFFKSSREIDTGGGVGSCKLEQSSGLISVF